jgi:hypothetical protein
MDEISCLPMLITASKIRCEETNVTCHNLKTTRNEKVLGQRLCEDTSCSDPADEDDRECFSDDFRQTESNKTPRVSNKSFVPTTYSNLTSQPLGFLHLLKDTIPVQGCQKRGRFLVWPVGIGGDSVRLSISN